MKKLTELLTVFDRAREEAAKVNSRVIAWVFRREGVTSCGWGASPAPRDQWLIEAHMAAEALKGAYTELHVYENGHELATVMDGTCFLNPEEVTHGYC